MTEPSSPHPCLFSLQNTTVIVGLSGGPDSICLLHFLHKLKNKNNLNIIAAHLDHEWQNTSKIAVKTCESICNSLGITLISNKLSEIEFEPKWNGSKEELGRNMRRYFFESIAQKHSNSVIALAHHQQDQHETFFIRLLRSSSLSGLIGMKQHDGLYVRPLLDWTKQKIMQYLQDYDLTYYTDPTNLSDVYLRNRIRNHVIPSIQKIDDRFEKNLTSTMKQLSQAEDFIQKEVSKTMITIATDQGIDIIYFLQLHTIIQQNILLRLIIQNQISCNPSQKLFKEIMRFLEKSTKNKHILHESWMIQKNKKYFLMIKYIKNDKNL